MQLFSFQDALLTVLDHASKMAAPDTETVDLLSAQGRVLAEPLRAERDHPPFNRATRDGFAVRAPELAAGPLRIVGQIRAGDLWNTPIPERAAVEIMTGAPVPADVDAVVMVEHIERMGDEIRLIPGRMLAPGDNLVPRGSEARAGSILIPSGTEIGAAEIAIAATEGCSTWNIFRRPRVSIIATGDELVELHQTPAAHQIRNSNTYALSALVTAAGGEAVRLPIASDERQAIRERIEEGRRSELILLSGGVSMGKYDLVEEVLESLGATFFFTGVSMQPGKPVVFGQLPAVNDLPPRYFFGLPGNPISTQVTFRVFVEPLLRALRGAGTQEPQFVQATLAEDIPGRPGLTRLLPARLSGVEVKLVPWHGSGDMAANGRANCYLLLPADRDRFQAGEIVRVLLR